MAMPVKTMLRAPCASTVLTAFLTLGAVPNVSAQLDPATVGQWSPVYPWPDVGIHLSYLPTGKIMTFSDDDDDHYESAGTRKADFTKTYIVEMPHMQPPGAVTYLPNRTTDMFCSGHTFLANGQLIVLGGHEGTDYLGASDVNFLDYAKNTKQYRWRLDGTHPMNGGRWYASVSTLPNGEVVVVSGSKSGVSTNLNLNVIAEVWQTNTPGGGWRELSGASLPVDLYPRLHVAPNGKVFMSGASPLTRYLDTAGTGRWTNVATRQYGNRDYASSVMYQPGKVMIAGGGDPPTATAETIDLTAVTPSWTYAATMRYPRRHANGTI
jgi:galactose oxidase